MPLRRGDGVAPLPAQRSAVAGAARGPHIDPHWQSDKGSPVRLFAFYLGLAFVFVRFSFIHEISTSYLGLRTYLPWLLGLPAFLGVILSGGIRRTFRHRPAYYWTAFALWLILATPFSSWKGGSVSLLLFFFKTEFPMLFLGAGLPMDWRECRKMFVTIALAATVNVAMGRFFLSAAGGRMSLVFGSIANSNDLAAHLLLVLPFLLLIALESKRLLLLRLAPLLLCVYGIYLIVGTGSRGGLVALLASLGFLVARFPGRTRLAALVIIPIGAVALISVAPKYAIERMASLFKSEDVSDPRLIEAISSKQARIELLRAGARLTLQHPLFGVGPGEFQDYYGTQNRESGRLGPWQVSHNSYTEVSSEAGIPALIFFLGALLSTYRLLGKTYRLARSKEAYQPMAMAALCAMLALFGFCIAIFFLTLAYRYYLYALSGLAISLASAAEREIASSARPAG